MCYCREHWQIGQLLSSLFLPFITGSIQFKQNWCSESVISTGLLTMSLHSWQTHKLRWGLRSGLRSQIFIAVAKTLSEGVELGIQRLWVRNRARTSVLRWPLNANFHRLSRSRCYFVVLRCRWLRTKAASACPLLETIDRIYPWRFTG